MIGSPRAAALVLAVSLLAAVAATASAGCMLFEDQVSLLNCGVYATATGTRRVRMQADCAQNLRVEVQDVPRGLYSVQVDGVDRGAIRVTGKHESEIEFDTTPRGNDLLLDFVASGHIDVVSASGRVVLSLDQCPAQ